mmetsp:Transcript_11215/g.20588  ORF Transcript_11215/g.20588 Transcript_11215/m.20588 type:complete len:177 (-) Transcript_11215:269-799(-)
MEEGMIDGLSVPDALALALCFGTVVVGGICWLRTTVTPEEKRNPKQTQSAAIAMKDIQNRAPRKNRDLGLEDLECALKEAELSEMLPSPIGSDRDKSLDFKATTSVAETSRNQQNNKQQNIQQNEQNGGQQQLPSKQEDDIAVDKSLDLATKELEDAERVLGLAQDKKKIKSHKKD